MLGFHEPFRETVFDRAIAEKICAMIAHMTGDQVEPIKAFVISHPTLPRVVGETMHGLALNPKVRVDRNIVPTIRRLTVGWMESYHRFFLQFKNDPDHPATHSLPYNVAQYAALLAQEPKADESTSSAQNGQNTNKRRSSRRPPL